MTDDNALDALLEVCDQLKAQVSRDLLRKLLTIEQAHAFDDRQDVALREVEAVVDAYLREGAKQ